MAMLLELRKLKTMPQMEDSLPFQAELWGKASSWSTWRKIADVSNTGTGGCHRFFPANREIYQLFVQAVAKLQAGPLDMANYLHWALYHFYSQFKKIPAPSQSPLKNEFEVADDVVNALIDYPGKKLATHWLFQPPKEEDYLAIKKGNQSQLAQDRQYILSKYPGATIINDLAPPALPMS